jgi:hypothetical protein
MNTTLFILSLLAISSVALLAAHILHSSKQAKLHDALSNKRMLTPEDLLD